MIKKFPVKGLALVATVAMLGGTAWIAAGTTGAYFSDTHSGSISGTVGSIKVTPYGGAGANGMDLSFSNMLPGESQTARVNYQNTGANAEDVWIVFNNATALSSLNNMGTFGEVHLSANGTALFDSVNLNDRSGTCGAFSPSGCWPLAKQYLVAANLAPGAAGSVSFAFNLASRTKAAGPVFNPYPVSPQGYLVTHDKNDQNFVDAADGQGSGLPYRLVATQHGVTP